jgi:hypothetical protein
VSFFEIIDFSHWVGVDIALFQKYKKNKKNQNLQKKKVEGSILKPKQHFTYKYRSTTQKYEGVILNIWGEATQKRKP